MNKTDALAMALDLWRWLAKEPTQDKDDYDGEYAEEVSDCLSWCPLCQSTVDINKPMKPVCNDCPMYGHWPDKDAMGGVVNVCYQGVYDLWEDNKVSCVDISPENRAHLASVIADAIQERLEAGRDSNI